MKSLIGLFLIAAGMVGFSQTAMAGYEWRSHQGREKCHLVTADGGTIRIVPTQVCIDTLGADFAWKTRQGRAHCVLVTLDNGFYIQEAEESDCAGK